MTSNDRRGTREYYLECESNRKYAEEQEARHKLERETNYAAAIEVQKAKKAADLQAYLKKETPEEYKARKEQQAQRTVKKETPEEYAARTEYMKKKEQLELEAETQRLFNKGEKKHQDHLTYLYRQEQKAERQAERDARADARDAAFEEKRAYNNSAEGRAKAEKTRNWNTPEEIRKREKNQEEWEIHQKNHLDSYIARSKRQYEDKDKIRETHFNTGKWEDKVDRNYKHAMSLR